MTTRICTKCSKEQDIEQFRKLHGDGFSNMCENCRKYVREGMRKLTKEERTAKHRAWREGKGKDKHQSYMRNYNLINQSGITTDQYIALYEYQEGVCAICHNPPQGSRGNEYLHVDHDHETGYFRGLLCTNCNTALGLLKDSVANLESAISYLGALKRSGHLDSNLKVVKQ